MPKSKIVPVKSGRVVFSTREDVHISESIQVIDERGNTITSARLEALSTRVSFTTFLRRLGER